MPSRKLNSPSAEPFDPHPVTNLPFGSKTWMSPDGVALPT